MIRITTKEPGGGYSHEPSVEKAKQKLPYADAVTLFRRYENLASVTLTFQDGTERIMRREEAAQ